MGIIFATQSIIKQKYKNKFGVKKEQTKYFFIYFVLIQSGAMIRNVKEKKRKVKDTKFAQYYFIFYFFCFIH